MSAHLSHEEFFGKLAELFEQRKSKGRGSIFLVQKRLTYGQDTASTPPAGDDSFSDLHPANPLPVIVRATNGKSKKHRDDKIKLSTIVQPDALESFFASYANICKGGMSALKPRDRSKKKAKSRKKKGGAVTAVAAA
ncbi:signal recognition particle 14kD protein [Colletotrichum paranaense]|uniref:Signal recognition particle subunit SRP14 n=4 Tax=Colletotrichum acutatum species complex TaxID=2707335 RepID=A0A9Q0B7Z6_9PEZI|nr:signal recognition particle 14kD protein [Colletotrichum paranaense]XP_060405752.1 signal recognition particle 14kD protein [Colletotrichum abscissum]KAK0368293.1 signal recognition particle 14kD protein [Colletotrichum limetticola]KAK1451563.1 signal recognition particle 14kD protein [Colletotrichum melonis]KAK1714717.1 signal recognition particle 14kD protein [Colletotrichum lupini]KAI3558740.1 signal recognition particle 14kD protein [Colletotrichum abscissum]KAK1523589.1 signal recogni